MIRKSTLLLAVVLGLQAEAQTITSVTTSPTPLTECSLVTLTTNGMLPNGIAPTNFSPGTQVGNNIPLTIFAGSNPPGGAYSVDVNLGPYPPGTYTFTVNLVYQGNVVDTETITRTILAGTNPDPGLTATHSPCTSDPTVTLLSLLGGTPDPGGVWTDPFNQPVTNGNFDPGVSPAGTYTYVFNVLPPCIPAASQVIITYLPNNDPGTPGSVQVCASGGGPNLNLFSYLGGTPLTNGTWTKPGGGAHNGTYVPGVDPVGVYTYSVPGIAPCGPPSSTVTVQAVQPPNAGTGSSAQVCYNDADVQLNQYLTGNPQNSGVWFDPLGAGIGGWTSSISALTSVEGDYAYVVFANICPNDTAIVALSYLPPPCTPGFEELEGDVLRFDVMPNPSDGHVALEVELLSAGRGQRLDVLNVNGQVVYSVQFAFTSNWVRHDVDLTGLAKGVYMLQLTSDNGRAMRRAIIH
jgi:hypothetical protein